MKFLRWAGSKERLLPELLTHIPQFTGTYFEPFVGGGSLFFEIKPENAVLNDTNADLIEMYRTIADPSMIDDVIKVLQTHRRHHSPAWYDAVRAAWNRKEQRGMVTRAAAFIYLNRTCFNGLWRVNKSGEFNVPIGKQKDPHICPSDALRLAGKALQGASLLSMDYRESVNTARHASRGDLVYFDPPYDDTFTAFTADDFGPQQQEELADTASSLLVRGVDVVVSNSLTPRIRKLYRGWNFHVVARPGTINSDGGARGSVAEVIITPKPARRRKAASTAAAAPQKD